MEHLRDLFEKIRLPSKMPIHARGALAMLPTLFHPPHIEYSFALTSRCFFSACYVDRTGVRRTWTRSTFTLAVYQVMCLRLLSLRYVEAGSYRVDHAERTVNVC